MKSLSKAVIIVLTTVALSSYASADWWAGWGNRSADNKDKVVIVESQTSEAKKIDAVITEGNMKNKSSSTNWEWWNGWDSKSDKKIKIAEEAKAEEAKVIETEAVEITSEKAGVTDDKIAALFKQLMDKNPNIKIDIVKNIDNQNSQSDSVVYKISGKAGKDTIQKLVSLIKKNEAIEIVPKQQERPSVNNFRFQQNFQQPRFNYQQPSTPQYMWYPIPMLAQPPQK